MGTQHNMKYPYLFQKIINVPFISAVVDFYRVIIVITFTLPFVEKKLEIVIQSFF